MASHRPSGASGGCPATGPSQLGEAASPLSWQEEACGQRYLCVALPKPAPARRVFRPARRVSWGTWIFVIVVLLIAIGALGGFLEIVLPQRVAQLAQTEAGELALARKGTADGSTNVSQLWAALSTQGTMGLSS